MKKVTIVETLVLMLMAGTVFAACQVVDVTDEQGNIIGNDTVCTKTQTKQVTKTLSFKQIIRKINNKKTTIEELTAERERDYNRTTERIAVEDADLTLLRGQRDEMIADGAVLSEEDQLAMAVVYTNETKTAGADE